MKIALIHDWLNQIGGAEDVLAELVKLFPNSPIYTSLYAPDIMPEFYKQWDIRPLWMDKLPKIHSKHQPYLPIYPIAWGGLKLTGYDLILSNKSGFCHGVRYDERTIHICYCLAPTRYVWQLDEYVAREGLNRLAQIGIRAMLPILKWWDKRASKRVHHFIAISTEIQARIKRYYERESVIIYPPVDTARFALTDEIPEDYFLVVSRLIPYKRIDLAVRAATQLGVRLKIAGKGRDLDRLKRLAGDTVEFLGYVSDDELPRLMARCQAFIFPGLEDFGITPVQAQAAGRPVIAYGGGGALDTVIPSVTGEHFSELTVESLMAVMRDFDASRYDTQVIRAHAQKFDVSVFREQLLAFIEAHM